MNSQITLFSGIAELTFTKQTRRENSQNQNLNRERKQIQPETFNVVRTKFDQLLTHIFSTIENTDILPVLTKIEEDIIDEFGLCVTSEQGISNPSDNEIKLAGRPKLSEVKNKLERFDGLDIFAKSYEYNNTIHQKLVLSDPQSKDIIHEIFLTDESNNNYDLYISTYLATIISKFGRILLLELGKQLVESEIVSTPRFDLVQRQLQFNPYAKIARWMVVMKNVIPSYIPIIGGHLLSDDGIKLLTIYTLLVTAKPCPAMVRLYEMHNSQESLNTDDESEKEDAFQPLKTNQNERPNVTFITPAGIEINRMLLVNHRIAKLRQIQTTRNVKYRNIVRAYTNGEMDTQNSAE